MHVEQHHTCVAPNITAVLEDIVEKLHFAVDTTGQRLLQVTIVSSTLCFAVQKSARRDRNTLLYKQFSFVHLSVSLYFLCMSLTSVDLMIYPWLSAFIYEVQFPFL